MKNVLLIGWFFIAVNAVGQIRVTHPVRNLGDIFEKGGKVSVSFELSNPYRSDTIFITDVSTSCGCTAVLSNDTLILPLSTVNLDVSYDPSGRLGLFVKSIELTTRTGRIEQNKLFLKITGNVVAENFTVKQTNQQLLEYLVAPIYFYPVTTFDTSYLDFNYISNFVDELTYEVDFYQFTTLGVEVELPDYSSLPDIENLISYVRKKIKREFARRGFDETTFFFDEPVFQKATELPSWAAAGIRLYSVNFSAAENEESSIRLTAETEDAESKILLDYERFALPEIDEIVEQVNLELIEGKLFLNGSLELEGMVEMPWKKSEKVRDKTTKKLQKAIQKKIEETTGAGKKEVRITFDPSGIHENDKYRFILWDKADLETIEKLRYREKTDLITPPLLPSFKDYPGFKGEIDTASAEFQHFWQNCLLNIQAGFDVSFVILVSESIENAKASAHLGQTNWTHYIENEFQQLYAGATGGDTAKVVMKNIQHGPPASVSKHFDRNSFGKDLFTDYYVILPIVHHQPDLAVEPAKPYMVNFDFFFKGIDTGAWGFQRFVNYLSAAVKKNGYVELRIESSISKIPVEKEVPNLAVAYRRLFESKERIKSTLAKKLIDPDRIIFVDESAVVQGPSYDGTIPILKYRNFHYIRIIPEESLK